MYNQSEIKIVWQKWSNPFGSEEEIDAMNHYLPEDIEEEIQEHEEELYEPNTLEDHNKDMSMNKLRVIATPMGILPLTENTDICNIFNFWIGHSNFDITKNIANIIEQVPGVETLDIYTRYRFRVGVGKAFVDSDVMRDINDEVYEYIENAN